MAVMIPAGLRHDDFNDSVGEERIYQALTELPDDYYVFHSVRWNKRHVNGRVQWGENDFVIYHPKRGILVMEVKSGGISFRNGRWFQTNLNTKEEHMLKRSPMLQADYGKYTFLDLLTESEDVNVRECRIEPIVWFPSVSDRSAIGEMPNEYHAENVFTQKNFENVEKSLEAAFDFYSMKKKDCAVSDSEIRKVIKILSPNFNVTPSLADEADDQDFEFSRLTREQSFLLDYLEEQHTAAIQGGGGTGKTMLAIEKARRLASDGKVLFLCFNRLLLEYLKENYAEKSGGVEFYNLYSLCRKMTGMFGEINDTTITNFLNRYDHYEWDFKHIIIDEGQDFYAEHLEILRTIAELTGGDFYVFYDKNQLVQRYENNYWLDKMECRLVLSRNCRNTVNIAATALASIGAQKVRSLSGISGQKPTLFFAKSKEEALLNIAEEIRHYTEQGLKKKQIVILTLKTEEDSILADEESIGGYRISDEPNDGQIFFTTARKFKGLESDVVILVDFDDAVFDEDMGRRLLYVASSRAKHLLHLVGIMNDAQIEYLALKMMGEKKRNPKLAIAGFLKVKVVGCRHE